MARRLEQLQAALGEQETPPAKATGISPQPTSVNSRVTSGTARLIITAIMSALFGAGMMWLSTSGTSAPTTPAASLHSATAAPVVAPLPAEAKPLAPLTTEISDKAHVGDLLENWRKSWMLRDVSGYLNAYSQNFAPADGNSHDAWVAARTSKLSAGAPIDIQIRELGVERINADQFKATFLQDYASGSYREMARTKTLIVARENGTWKITKEWITDNKPITR